MFAPKEQVIVTLLFSFLCRSQSGETPQRRGWGGGTKAHKQEAGGAGAPRHDTEERPRSEAPRAKDLRW